MIVVAVVPAQVVFKNLWRQYIFNNQGLLEKKEKIWIEIEMDIDGIVREKTSPINYTSK